MVSDVPLASITSFLEQHSQWAMLMLFVLLMLESFGFPVPGETVLIACSVLASQGSLSIVWVIVVGVLPRSSATTSAIGRPERGAVAARATPPDSQLRGEVPPRGQRVFAKHGGKAVFLAASSRFSRHLRVDRRAFAPALVALPLWDAPAGSCGRQGWRSSPATSEMPPRTRSVGTAGRGGGAVLLTVLGFLIVRRLEKRGLDED